MIKGGTKMQAGWQAICESGLRTTSVFTVQTSGLASQAEKRQRSFDKVVDEWKRKVADLQGELERSQKESRANATEVYRMKAMIEESQDQVEAVRRENKNLTGKCLEHRLYLVCCLLYSIIIALYKLKSVHL
jgi:peptidoglycan hydrolase CwlO-like protein